MPNQPPKDPNQGEGDRISARRYNREVEDFVAEGKVDEAAREAAQFVQESPEDARRAERAAKHGPHPIRESAEELFGKARSVVERARPYAHRLATRIKDKLRHRA